MWDIWLWEGQWCVTTTFKVWAFRSHSREGSPDDWAHESFWGRSPHQFWSVFFLFCFLLSSGTFKYKLVPWRNFRRQLFGVQSNTSVWMSYCVKELSWNWTQAVFVNVTFQTHLKHKLWLMVHFELWMPISLPFIFWLSVALSFTLFLRKCGCEQIHTSPSLPPIGFWEWTPRI